MRSTGHRAALVLPFCLSLAVAAAQQPTFKSGTQIVSLFATVTDAQKRLVPDLVQDDFEVFDNEKPQPLVFFENEVQPISVVVMLDTSGSMTLQLDLLRQAAPGVRQPAAAVGLGARRRVQRQDSVQRAVHERSRSARRPTSRTSTTATARASGTRSARASTNSRASTAAASSWSSPTATTRAAATSARGRSSTARAPMK